MNSKDALPPHHFTQEYFDTFIPQFGNKFNIADIGQKIALVCTGLLLPILPFLDLAELIEAAIKKND